MTAEKTTRANGLHKKRREYLIKQFGGKCRYCGTPDIEMSSSPMAKKLEFAHKVGHRISGINRGRNARINEIFRDKSKFWLACTSCHRKYDEDHPLTDYEKDAMKEEIPF